MSQRGRRRGRPEKCVCPSCGTEAPHVSGKRCIDIKCPKCGNIMVAKK